MGMAADYKCRNGFRGLRQLADGARLLVLRLAITSTCQLRGRPPEFSAVHGIPLSSWRHCGDGGGGGLITPRRSRSVPAPGRGPSRPNGEARGKPAPMTRAIIAPMDFAEARRVVAAFERHQVAYVVVGSMAMAAQGIVRATRDIDVFVAPDAPNVDRLRAALRDLFDDPAVESITAEDLAGDYPAIQYVPPSADYWIDILSRLGEAFRFADLEAEVLDLDGVPFRTATARMLYRMKRDTVRPQDRLDAQVLKDRFGLEDD